MIKIGDFSKLSRVSVRMLRHYEKLGLLIPSYVDDLTGYRFYDVNKLSEINKISLLKEMGFSLAIIQEIVSDVDNKDKLKEYLYKQRNVVQNEKESINNRLLILNNTLNNLDKEIDIMEYTVIVKEIPKRHVMSARQVVENYQAEGKVWEALGSAFEKQAVKLANPCYPIAIFHDKEYREADVDIEVQMSVEGKYESTDKVVFKDVEPIQVASTIFEGDYSQFPLATEAVVKWIEDNDYEYNGPNFSINHVSPGQEPDPKKWVTEICIPIKKKD